MNITVKKLTDVELLQRADSFTTVNVNIIRDLLNGTPGLMFGAGNQTNLN